MTDIDIQKEINARVKFKFDEFKTALRNRVRFKWQDAHDGTTKSMLIWQIMDEIEKMIDKEVTMSHPWPDDQIEKRKWQAKETAIKELEEAIDFRGRREFEVIVRKLVSIVEKPQNY